MGKTSPFQLSASEERSNVYLVPHSGGRPGAMAKPASPIAAVRASPQAPGPPVNRPVTACPKSRGIFSWEKKRATRAEFRGLPANFPDWYGRQFPALEVPRNCVDRKNGVRHRGELLPPAIGGILSSEISSITFWPTRNKTAPVSSRARLLSGAVELGRVVSSTGYLSGKSPANRAKLVRNPAY